MRLKSMVPSPAMVIAMIALIISASGVAYAAGTINGKTIKKGTVSGKALKKNTLTGTQIKESKLGKVPSAKNADNAAIATTSASTSVVSFQAIKAVDAAANFAAAPAVDLGGKGPFSFYGKCYVNGANVEATTYIASTSGNGLFDTEAEDSGYVTPATAESSRKLQDVTASANSFDAGDGDKDFTATDGATTLYGILGLAAAKQGSPAEGDGPFGAGNRCLFGGVVFN
ncbi:MAG: hypothetical protein ACRDKI_07755 [Solirubrobacterales bacterium]